MSETGSPPSDNGKLWAALSYVGIFMGLPIGAIPLLQRDDAYALRHGKTATAVWLGVFGLSIIFSLVYSAIVTITCGFGFFLLPMVMLPWLWGAVVGGHGLLITMNGQWDEPIGGFGLGERLFPSILLKEGGPPLISSHPSPPPAPPPPPPPPAV